MENDEQQDKTFYINDLGGTTYVGLVGPLEYPLSFGNQMIISGKYVKNIYRENVEYLNKNGILDFPIKMLKDDNGEIFIDDERVPPEFIIVDKKPYIQPTTEQEEPLFPELNPIKIELVPLFIRKEWKTSLKDDAQVIKDQTIVGPSKIFKDCKFPFTINLYSPEHFIIFFKLNVPSQIVQGEVSTKMMATYLSRKTWKTDISKLPKKVD